jgi:DNA polymerase III epsilon subunit family exonuclease
VNAALSGAFVVVDCETTGIFPDKGARICEIGAVRVEGGAVVAEYTTLVDPCMPMPSDASAVNGIYDLDLCGAPRFSEIADEFAAFVGDLPVMGYRVEFDRGFILAEYARIGRVFPARGWFDVLKTAKTRLSLPHYKLVQVAAHLGVRVSRAHRALDDAKTTLAVYERLCSIANEHHKG